MSIPPQRPGLVLHNVPHPNDSNPKPGRPPHKYSRELHADIVSYLKAGHSPENVAKAAGISTSTFWKWVQAGRAGDAWLADFAVDVDAAIGASLMVFERVVTEAAKDDPKMALTVLERRDPTQWGKVNQSTQMQEVMSRFLAACEAAFPEHIFVEILSLAAGAGNPAAALGTGEDEPTEDE